MRQQGMILKDLGQIRKYPTKATGNWSLAEQAAKRLESSKRIAQEPYEGPRWLTLADGA